MKILNSQATTVELSAQLRYLSEKETHTEIELAEMRELRLEILKRNLQSTGYIPSEGNVHEKY